MKTLRISSEGAPALIVLELIAAVRMTFDPEEFACLEVLPAVSSQWVEVGYWSLKGEPWSDDNPGVREAQRVMDEITAAIETEQ